MRNIQATRKDSGVARKTRPGDSAGHKSILSPDLSPEEFTLFRDYIAEHSGLYLDESKMDSLRISLLARTTHHDLRSYLEYLDFMRKTPDEFNELLSLITNNETSFFRYPAQFDTLRALLPEVMARKAATDRQIRIWSAGCSTGEEPYSIGMTLLDFLGDDVSWRIEVLGTDVSKRALAICDLGEYGDKAVKHMDERYLRTYMDKCDSGWCVRPEVRRAVSFGYQNLIKEPYPLAVMGNWDIIFCRNVTIYFKPESTKRVIRNFHQSLNPGGYLFVGHSETLSTMSADFKTKQVGEVFVYQKEEGEPAESTRSHKTSAPQAGNKKTGPSEVVVGLFNEAHEQFKLGNLDNALPLLERVRAQDPRNADVHLILAYVYANKGDYAKATAACRTALELAPLSARGHYFLGVIYSKEGLIDEAENEFKKTLYIDSNFALAHLNLANIYRAQGKSDLARRSYHNAVDLLLKEPQGEWMEFLDGFMGDMVLEMARRGLKEVSKQKASG